MNPNNMKIIIMGTDREGLVRSANVTHRPLQSESASALLFRFDRWSSRKLCQMHFLCPLCLGGRHLISAGSAANSPEIAGGSPPIARHSVVHSAVFGVLCYEIALRRGASVPMASALSGRRPIRLLWNEHKTRPSGLSGSDRNDGCVCMREWASVWDSVCASTHLRIDE